MMMKMRAALVLTTLMTAAGVQAQDGSRVRTAMIRGMELPYEVIDGWAVHDGHIILGTAEEVARWTAVAVGEQRLTGVRRAVPSGYRPSGLFCIWEDGLIPYVIDDTVEQPQKDAVLEGIRIWDTQTVLRFVPRTSGHERYLHFTRGPISISGVGKCQEGAGAQVFGLSKKRVRETSFMVLAMPSAWSTRTSAGTPTVG